jgi:hypothetical protein
MSYSAVLETGRLTVASSSERVSKPPSPHGGHAMIPKSFQRHRIFAKACLRASTQQISVSTGPKRRRFQCAALPGLPSPQGRHLWYERLCSGTGPSCSGAGCRPLCT